MLAAELKSKNLNSLADYSQAMNSSIDTAKFVSFNTSRITGIGNEPVLAGAAPYSNVNELSQPIAGKNAVYVINVFNKSETETPFNADEEKKSLEGAMTYRVQYQAMEVLKNKAVIEDNRINFY